MARSIRIEFPGAFYHVMARGNRKQDIFLDEDDHHFFLKTLKEACGRTGWRVHAWALLRNHYHLLLETPEPNLVAGMKWLQNAYTRRINAKHRAWGRVFGDRYKAVLVQAREGDYYATLLDYIHLNPVRAGLVNVAEGGSVAAYPWTSVAGAYVLRPEQRAPWVAVERGFAACGVEDTAAGRREFVARLDARGAAGRSAGLVPVPEDADGRSSHLAKGWYWGSREFAKELLAKARESITARSNATYRSGPARHAHDERRAEEIVAEGLRRLRIREGELEDAPGADARKVALALAVLAETTIAHRWLARRLHMASAANVSQQIRRVRLGTRTLPPEVVAPLRGLSGILD